MDTPNPDSVDKDSGMSSANSKDETPERKLVGGSAGNPKSIDDTFDDEPEETFTERLWGLTEMFPEPLRNVTGAITEATAKSCHAIFNFTCNASWIFFTSSMILFAPVIFEKERAIVEEMQKSQQKQVLLGPGSMPGGGGAGAGGMPSLPPMTRS